MPRLPRSGVGAGSSRAAPPTPRTPAPVPVAPYTGPTRSLTVLGIPRSGKNSQRQVRNARTGGRFTIKSKAASDWLAAAIVQLVDQNRPRDPIAGACYVGLDIFHALALTRWDQDNVVNLVYDALKHAGVVVDDTAAIVRQGAQMTYVDTVHPRVEITIQPCTRALELPGRAA